MRFQKYINENKQDVMAFADKVEKELELKSFDVFMRTDGSLELNLLIVNPEARKKGTGSEAVKRLTKYADDNDYAIYVNPAVADDFQGTTSRSRLVKFYKRFGFVENKGRNKDFTYRGGMYRLPK